MYLFSASQVVRNERVVIPYEMRAILGYHQGCRVTLSYTANNYSILQNQILVSSIPHERRQDLWSLRACFKDRPGILTELTEYLTQFNLDIWSCYVATKDQNSEFVVDLDFDAQYYESQIDMTSAQRRERPRVWLQELYARIACQFIEDLALRSDRKPDIYLKRNHLLSRSVRNLVQRGVSEVQGGGISVSREMIETIKEKFIEVYGKEWGARTDKDRGSPLAMLVADPEFRGLTLTLFYPHTGHIHVRVEAKNQVGTIAMITNALFDSGFNILQAYTRNLHAAERSLTDLFLHFRPKMERGSCDDGGLRKIIKGILQEKHLKKLNCVVSFPKPRRESGRASGQFKKAAGVVNER